MKTLISIVVFTILSINNFQVAAQESVMYKLDSVLTIGKNTKMEFLYDSLGNNISVIDYDWSAVSMSFNPRIKMDYVYNKSGKVITEYYNSWINQSGLWKQFAKNDINYDLNGEIILINGYTWNSEISSWQLSNKIDYVNSYNDKNKISSTILFKTVKGSSDITKTKYDFFYDSSNRLSYTISYYLKQGFSTWNNSKKELFSYNSKGYLEKIELFSYNESTYAWNKYDLYSVESNTFVPANELKHVEQYFPLVNILPKNFQIPNAISVIQEDDFIWTKRYFYSTDINTGSKSILQNDISVFPNPTTDRIHFKWNGYPEVLTIEIYDLKGNKLHTSQVTKTDSQSIKSLRKGLYILTLIHGNVLLHSEKLIIQ